MAAMAVLLALPPEVGAAEQPAATWTVAAEHAEAALKRHYWLPAIHLFRNRADRDEEPGKGFNYWWQAHALLCMAETVRRGGTTWSAGDLGAFRDALVKQNGGHWTNDYFDDEGWMAIALLQCADATRDAAWRTLARGLWDDIRASWTDQFGGGIPWRKTQRDYKNAPANGPAIVIGATLYRADHQQGDLGDARRICDWLLKTLQDPQGGLIWDGVNRTGNGAIDKNWRFSYCQGIAIGGCLELYLATRTPSYLSAAERIGTVALDTFFTPATGLCPEGGNGDGGLFKGILVRNLAALAQASARLAPRIRQLLEANGRRLAQLQGDHGDGLLPSTWSNGAAPMDLELSADLSGVMLLEALSRIAAPR